jgi:hypothetical protein
MLVILDKRRNLIGIVSSILSGMSIQPAYRLYCGVVAVIVTVIYLNTWRSEV